MLLKQKKINIKWLIYIHLLVHFHVFENYFIFYLLINKLKLND